MSLSEDKIATIVDRVVHRLNSNEPVKRTQPATISPSGECGPKRSSPSRFDDAPIKHQRSVLMGHLLQGSVSLAPSMRQ